MTCRFDGVIFDNDGLLQDTEPHYEWSYRKLAKAYGRPEPSPEQLLGYKGLDLREVAKHMIETQKLPLSGYEEFKAQLDRRLMQRALLAQMMPGAGVIVRQLHLRGVPMAVATSSTREVLELKMSNYERLYSLFRCIVSGDDPEVKHGKPAPDLLLVCAKRMRVPPHKCVYLGDNPVDIAAAHAAGMCAVAIPAPSRDLAPFKDADHILCSLEEFLPLL